MRPLAHPASRRPRSGGFTLIELLIVVAIIGIVAAIAVPAMLSAVEKSRITRIAADLKSFETGFTSFSIDMGEWPDDWDVGLPPGVSEHVSEAAWNAGPPFGGRYNWEGPDFYRYAGISLTDSRATLAQARKIDALIDDGVLTTGAFRRTPNQRLTYILEE